MGPLKRLAKYNDLALALGLISVLFFLLVPLPAFLVDTMLGLSIAASILILMTTLLVSTPLELSAFPTILLITTVARLSLNVASTKLILANGHLGVEAAGKVICSFGQFVMQGSIVIGITIFLILTIINFVVITKGAGRIAEVAARFNLDSMPGKQMSIDSELATGSIDEEEAKTKRRELEAESTFYGAMDGANKFVRGDAIAGLIITFINLIGGIIIATIDKGMPLGKAVKTYSLLTVGDGLACQVPSLIISLASGLLVTKSSVGSTTNKAIFGQLSSKPIALGISSALSGLIAFIPGLPFIPFAAISALFGGSAYILSKEESKAPEVPKEEINKEESTYDYLKLDLIKIELGLNLLFLAKVPENLPEKIQMLRKQIARKLGFILPAIRLQDSYEIGATEYVIKVKEAQKASGVLYPGRVLILDKGDLKAPFKGIQVQEPTFGLPATWVLEDTELSEYPSLNCATVVINHLSQVIMENTNALLSYTDTQKLIEELSKSHKRLVQDAIPEPLSIATVKKILQRLLAEEVSIKDLPTIIESAAEALAKHKDIVSITEFVRHALADQICFQHLNAQKLLPVITVSDAWEKEISEAISHLSEGKDAVLAPSREREFSARLLMLLKQNSQDGYLPSILTNSSIRPYVKGMVPMHQIAVLGHNEVRNVKLKYLGSI